MTTATVPDRDARRELALDLDAATRPDRIRKDSRAHADHDPAFEQARSVGLRLEREGDNEPIVYSVFSGKMRLGVYWVKSQTLCIDGQERRYKTITDALLAIGSQRKAI